MSRDAGPRESRSARHEALALFLRARRKALAPEDVGLQPRTRRRNGGLSREEVAYLAGISADWYGRLEAGLAVVPSSSTLSAIARALRLSDVESDYLFELSGLVAPRRHDAPLGNVPDAVLKLIVSTDRVGMGLWDAYMTPIAWNAIADAMFDLSGYAAPLERNSVVRMLDPYYVAYFGDDYESVSRQVVGMFRRAHAAQPTDFSRQVFERAQAYPDFKRYWDEYVIADEATPAAGPHFRHHPIAGTISIVTTDLFMLRRHDVFLRAIAPAHADAASAFLTLRRLGTASTRP